jgi:hypothetical protein
MNHNAEQTDRFEPARMILEPAADDDGLLDRKDAKVWMTNLEAMSMKTQMYQRWVWSRVSLPLHERRVNHLARVHLMSMNQDTLKTIRQTEQRQTAGAAEHQG